MSFTSAKVQWAGFDKLECEGNIVRQVLLLGYRSGFQVWDVEEADDVRELVSRHDGSVSFLQMQQKPLPSKRSADKFADVRPLLVVVEDGGVHFPDGQVSPCIGSDTNCNELGNGNLMPTVVRFYSLRSYSYVHALKFRTAVFSVRCSPRVVAVSLAYQVFNLFVPHLFVIIEVSSYYEHFYLGQASTVYIARGRLSVVIYFHLLGPGSWLTLQSNLQACVKMLLSMSISARPKA